MEGQQNRFSHSARVDSVLGLAVSAFAFLAYLPRVAPTILKDDAGEMQVLVRTPGIAHSIGYPFYIWLTHAFTFLPFGEPAYRVSLASAVYASVAVFFLFRVTLNLSAGSAVSRQVAALSAALLFSLSHTFLSVAIIPEMYTLQVALSLGVLLLLLRWDESAHLPTGLGAAFLAGAAFGNHLSSVGLLPGIAVFAVLQGEREHRVVRIVTLLAAAGVVGILLGNVGLFWCLWRRDLPYDYWHKVILTAPDLFPGVDARSFWSAWSFSFFSKQVSGELLHPPAGFFLWQLKVFPFRLLAEVWPAATAAAAVGWLLMWRAPRRNILLTLFFFAPVFASATFAATTKTQIYLLMPFALAAVYAGLALGRFTTLSLEIPKLVQLPGRSAVNQSLVTGTLLCLVAAVHYFGGLGLRLIPVPRSHSVWSVIRNGTGSLPDASGYRQDRKQAREIIASVEPDAVLFTQWQDIYPLEYVARFERGLTKLEFYQADPLENRLPQHHRAILERIAQGRPVYFGFNPEHFPAIESVRYTRLLWRVKRFLGPQNPTDAPVRVAE